MDKQKRIWRKAQLTLAFAFVVFIILLAAIFLVFLGMFTLSHLGLISLADQDKVPLASFAIVSLIVGTVIAVLFSALPLRPIREVMEATDKVAAGDYGVRLNLKGPDEFRDLSCKFNHMAEELQSVELLRSDFVGNFSHEFKTPIVSIRGFAKALKWDDLTKEEREEYLDIIIAESERLSELSANVLSLSKIEQQTILTGKERYNLSEQIRLVIAMMDGKWSKKRINYQFDCSEIFVDANKELMKQVWINLLDNAIKFSEDSSVVSIEICKIEGNYAVSIANQGDPIPGNALPHIFDKFFQGDRSHATKGNGLGLSIARRIIQLHKGDIAYKYSGNRVIFTVCLPD